MLVSFVLALCLSLSFLNGVGVRATLLPRTSSTNTTTPSLTAYNLSTPLDHFHNDTRYSPHTNATFPQTYWFDSTHYKPGGPVIYMPGAEAAGSLSLDQFSSTIIMDLVKKYNGLAVLIEHRYYGNSWPFGHGDIAGTGTDQIDKAIYRFLSTEQSLADIAFFAENIVFPGLEGHDITPRKTKWIAYGGSYGGAQVAFLRKLYPHLFHGAIASSGVTAAVENFWEYYEPARLDGPGECIEIIQGITALLDTIFIEHPDDEELHAAVQKAYGLQEPIDNLDFLNIFWLSVAAFQSRNWTPSNAGDAGMFRAYCDNITHPEIIYPSIQDQTIEFLPKILEKAGHNASDESSLFTAMRNQVGFLGLGASPAMILATTPLSAAQENFENNGFNASKKLTANDTTSWNYQVCTEWGYFLTGTPPAESGIKPLLSRLIDEKYKSAFCRNDFNITTAADGERINRYGGFNFSYPRVAHIGGAADPWRDATPFKRGLEMRNSTDDEPFILIDIPAENVWDEIRGAGHCWDMRGPDKGTEAGEKPEVLEEVQREIVRFVGVWLED